MKNIIYNSLLILAAVLLLQGCYTDKSSLDTTKIDDITIESESMGSILRVDYLEDVTFEPTVKMGSSVNPADVAYRWQINETPGSTELKTIGEERVLSTTIKNSIVSSAYTLIFTAIDTKNGIEYQKSWPLFVSSSFREGILIADTKDGSHSDISLVMDNDITTSYDKGLNIKRDIWHNTIGESHPSLIKSITYSLHKPSAVLTKNIITAIFDNNDIAMYNCEDYSIHRAKYEIFPAFDETFNPSNFGTINNAQWSLVINDKIYIINSISSVTAFMLPASGDNYVSNGVVVNDNASGAGPFSFWYNSVTGKFSAITMTFTNPATGGAYTTQGVFDPTAVPNREAIAADISMDGNTSVFLLKDVSSGNYELYGISFGYYDASYNLTPSVPKIKVVLPQGLNSIIASAKSIFFDMFNPVMYIATSSEIYSVTFGGGVVSYSQRYSAPAGESIDIAKLYVQGRYRLLRKDFNSTSGPIYEEPLALNTKAIAVATSKAGYEGSLYMIPIATQSSGVLDAQQSKKYTGFGKILDFTFQGQ